MNGGYSLAQVVAVWVLGVMLGIPVGMLAFIWSGRERRK